MLARQSFGNGAENTRGESARRMERSGFESLGGEWGGAALNLWEEYGEERLLISRSTKFRQLRRLLRDRYSIVTKGYKNIKAHFLQAIKDFSFFW